MADEPRVWADIDETWLQDYLEKHDLASGFDLDDELIGAQVSWILDAKEWAKLRDAWQEEQGDTGTVDTVQAPTAEELPTATETPLESAHAELSEEDQQAAEAWSGAIEKSAEPAAELGVAATKAGNRPEDSRLIRELAQKALSDWGAFKELFINCPEVQGVVDTWEIIADSPIAMLMQAEELIRRQEAEAKAHKDQLEQEREQEREREREGEVNRARNIIAGYFGYCGKHRIVPSMEHLVDFIPVLSTEFSSDAVKEAWRREAERAEA